MATEAEAPCEEDEEDEEAEARGHRRWRPDLESRIRSGRRRRGRRAATAMEAEAPCEEDKEDEPEAEGEMKLKPWA
ncbi:hypothetical protein U1Q18_024767 [Sarracenia purpurea var. burkii]